MYRFESVPLDFVKNLKNTAKVSINDVIYTCLGHAIQGYLEAMDCQVYKDKGKGVKCRSLMPVALPLPSEFAKDKVRGLCNRW